MAVGQLAGTIGASPGWRGGIVGGVTSLAVRAPGRVNLIGEHTDYNHGFVLPVAIDLGITIAFEPTIDRRIDLRLAADGRSAIVELDAIGRRRGDWTDYVAGTAWALTALGAPISGFRGTLSADLPAGAGLSSSAALELAVAWALGGGAPPLDDLAAVARAAQRAENEFVGVACGLMDQYAVTFGEAGRALLLDCRSVSHRTVRLPDGLAIVVVDSGVRRRLAASGYGDRRAACERAVGQIRATGAAVESLRDVTREVLEAARPAMDDEAYRRARHVVTENDRVLATAEALEASDLDALGRLFAAGHASLRDDLEVSTPELDRLVEVATAVPGVVAARMTGGGFGGSIVALADPGAVEGLGAAVQQRYRPPSGTAVTVRQVRASQGVHAVGAAAAVGETAGPR
jgi:galactokinase